MGPVRSGDRLCQTRLIPRSPDGDNNSDQLYLIEADLNDTRSCFKRNREVSCVEKMCKYFVTVFFWDVHWSKYILRYNVHILISCMTCYMFFGLEKPSQKMSLTILFPRVLDKSQLGDPMFSALRHSLSAQQNF